MRPGHRAAQRLFEALGRSQGFEPARTYSPKLPTDGVWFHKGGVIDALPVVAIEVVVSESPKLMKGSVRTLELVSPALGVLLLENEEIWRGRVRKGDSDEKATAYVARVHAELLDLAARSGRRIEVWTISHLRKLHRWACEIELHTGTPPATPGVQSIHTEGVLP